MLTGRKGVVKDDDYSKTTFTTSNLPRVLPWSLSSSLGSGHFAASILGQQDAGTNTKVIRHPDRYWDEHGKAIWATVWSLTQNARDAFCSEGKLSGLWEE